MIELDRTKHKWIIHTDRIDSIVVFSLYQIQNIIIHFPSFFHHDYLTRIWQCGQLARKILIHFRLILLLGLCHLHFIQIKHQCNPKIQYNGANGNNFCVCLFFICLFGVFYRFLFCCCVWFRNSQCFVVVIVGWSVF